LFLVHVSPFYQPGFEFLFPPDIGFPFDQSSLFVESSSAGKTAAANHHAQMDRLAGHPRNELIEERRAHESSRENRPIPEFVYPFLDSHVSQITRGQTKQTHEFTTVNIFPLDAGFHFLEYTFEPSEHALFADVPGLSLVHVVEPLA
jgi:hypothetical protein